MQDLLYGCVAEAVWSNGLLKIRAVLRRGGVRARATFTPNLSPIYDLTDDELHGRRNNTYQSPVVVSIKAVSDISTTSRSSTSTELQLRGGAGTTPDYNPTVHSR